MNRRAAIGALGVVAWPRIVFSQARPKHARLGVLLLGQLPALTDPFFAALGDKGWSVGKNLQVEALVTAREQFRAHEMARDLIQRGANVLVTVGTANRLRHAAPRRTCPS